MNTLSSQFLREIGALSRMIQTMSDSSARKYNLQKGQFIFITRIYENPGINHIQLTALLHVDKGTTSKAIQKLEKMGYIEKRRDQDDSRIQRLFPTARAEEIYSDLIEKEEFFISSVFGALPSSERTNLTGVIKTMRSNIEKEWEKEKELRKRR